MKAATVHELKQELVETAPDRLIELCLRLARFKKENKELLTYLLFESHDIDAYMNSIKQEMDTMFASINKSNVYFVKKSLRKILRTAAKFIRYSNSEIVETELLIHFCKSLKLLDKNINSNPVIQHIFQNQLKKIKKAVDSMHEDLQYDFLKEIEKLKSITY